MAGAVSNCEWGSRTADRWSLAATPHLLPQISLCTSHTVASSGLLCLCTDTPAGAQTTPPGVKKGRSISAALCVITGPFGDRTHPAARLTLQPLRAESTRVPIRPGPAVAAPATTASGRGPTTLRRTPQSHKAGIAQASGRSQLSSRWQPRMVMRIQGEDRLRRSTSTSPWPLSPLPAGPGPYERGKGRLCQHVRSTFGRVSL